MHTETELNEKILAKTQEIKEKHPELEKYINEMPVTIPNSEKPEINIEVLNAYYESLCNIVRQF